MLKTALQAAMQHRGLSSHSAAAEIGVSHTTVLRALRGDAVDVDTLVKIADWLHVRPSELLNSLSSRATLSEDLSVLLSHSSELEQVLGDLVQSIEDGKMNKAVLDEVVAFAQYKFSTAGGVTSHASATVSSSTQDRHGQASVARSRRSRRS